MQAAETELAATHYPGSKGTAKNGKGEPLESIEDSASWYSRLFLSYLNPLLKLGSYRPLEQVDLGASSVQDDSEAAYALLEQQLQREWERAPEERSLGRAVKRAFVRWKFAWAVSLYTISAAAGFGPVLILDMLVQHLEGTSEMSQLQIWVACALLFAFPVLASVCSAQHNVIVSHIGVQIRNALSVALYRKSMVLSPGARAETSTGAVVNMMSNDTQQTLRLLLFVGIMLLAPLQIALALYLTFQQVGAATWVGLALMIAFVPANVVLFATVAKFRKRTLTHTDERIKVMSELLAGIRIIKYYAWELPFSNNVERIRTEELHWLKKMAYGTAIGMTVILMSLPVIQPLLVFYTYISLGNELTAAKAFTTIALFNLMRFPFAFLPMGLSQLIQAKIGMRRMGRFLFLPELTNYVQKDADKRSGPAVSIKDATFQWEGKPNNNEGAEETKQSGSITPRRKRTRSAAPPVEKPATPRGLSIDLATEGRSSMELGPDALRGIQDLTIDIARGELVAIVGRVGSGKSSILSAILGEMKLESGSIQVSGSIAYCAQTPWILNATVRDNITFGSNYDPDRFRAVVRACALEDDLKVLPGGELAEIGERGINLSGGQKSRIGLARAAYRNADIILLDDPLSAVDAHVSMHLFRSCFQGFLADKTRLLVTHHVEYLAECDRVLVVEMGRVIAAGTYDQLLEQGFTFAGARRRSQVEAEMLKQAAAAAAAAAPSHPTMDAAAVESMSRKLTHAASKKSMRDLLAQQRSQKGGLVMKEERNVGSVDMEIIRYYLNAGGVALSLGMLAALILGRAIEIGSTFWLAYWAELSSEKKDDGDALSTKQNMFYLQIYAAFTVATLIALATRAVFMAQHRVNASLVLHKSLLQSVVSAPVSFFDVTPLGRVLNRFSADLDTVDVELTNTLVQIMNTFSSVLGAMASIAIATKGAFLVLLAPVGIVYYRVQKFFRKTSTEVQRLESISRSPIFADFSQTLSGITTIRAYGDSARFVKDLQTKIDNNSTPVMLKALVSQWLGIRLDMVGALVGFAIAAFVSSTGGFIPAGWLGLGLSASFELSQFLRLAVRMAAQAEAQMNSVERIKHYTDAIPREAVEGTAAAPAGWPSEGEIVAENVQLRYRDGPLVLKGLSFHIKPREKIGVAGRTGSGKSSLMNALFRISELAGGKLMIDGIDISTLGLRELRSNLCIIPQDPTVFSNTIRFNLDPFNQHSDAQLWEALERVTLKETIEAMPNKLMEVAAEGGENLSAGQRQLMCIARALLRRPRVIVMDEATSSVDNATDALIQEMIATSFAESTVLTIAHRLHTIIHNDRIMLLDGGKIAEFDTPDNLLQMSNGAFKALWEQHVENSGHEL